MVSSKKMLRGVKKSLSVADYLLRNLELALWRGRQMREPVGISQQQCNRRNASAKLRQRRMKRAISELGPADVRSLTLGVVFTAWPRFGNTCIRRQQERRFPFRQNRVRWHKSISLADGF